jgi:hypothetical protein
MKRKAEEDIEFFIDDEHYLSYYTNNNNNFSTMTIVMDDIWSNILKFLSSHEHNILQIVSKHVKKLVMDSKDSRFIMKKKKFKLILLKITFNAGFNGYISILRWVEQEGNINLKCAYSGALQSYNKKVLDWLENGGEKYPIYCENIWDDAIKGGISSINWIEERLDYSKTISSGWIYQLFKIAGSIGNISAIEWLKNHFELDIRVWEGAASGGHVQVFDWLERTCKKIMNSTNIEKISYEASKNGHLCVLEWMYSKWHLLNSNIINISARKGHLNILRWAHSKGLIIIGENFIKWVFCNPEENTIDLYRSAAEGGQISVLEWIKECGYLPSFPEKNIYSYAAKNGHLDVLKWAKEENYGYWNFKTSSHAAKGGFLDILIWLKEHNYSLWDSDIYVGAINGGHLSTFHWILENSFPYNDIDWSKCYLRESIKKGHFEMIKWAIDNKCPLKDRALCAFAAEKDRLDILKYLRFRGCPWNEKTCRKAAENGHLNILKWARENRCPWNKQTCRKAAQNGHLHILQWARENGCPWDEYPAVYAAGFGHFDVLRWIIVNRCPLNEYVSYHIVEQGNLELLKFARENNCPWDHKTTFAAKIYGYKSIYDWAIKNGCPEKEGEESIEDFYSGAEDSTEEEEEQEDEENSNNESNNKFIYNDNRQKNYAIKTIIF